jgi:hypothetical protein
MSYNDPTPEDTDMAIVFGLACVIAVALTLVLGLVFR